MKMKVYSVYDKKADSYGPLMVNHNDEAMIRDTWQVFDDPNIKFNKWPEDFTIMILAEWNQVTGVLVPLEKPAVLANMVSLRNEYLAAQRQNED